MHLLCCSCNLLVFTLQITNKGVDMLSNSSTENNQMWWLMNQKWPFFRQKAQKMATSHFMKFLYFSYLKSLDLFLNNHMFSKFLWVFIWTPCTKKNQWQWWYSGFVKNMKQIVPCSKQKKCQNVYFREIHDFTLNVLLHAHLWIQINVNHIFFYLTIQKPSGRGIC